MSSTFHKSSLTSTQNDQDTSHDPEEIPLTQLLSVSTTILTQALDLVENVLTSDEQLTIHSKYLPGSTIGLPGKHLRHARDHFLLLLDSVSSPPPHEFCYDIRVRNTPMESNLVDARAALKDIISKLEEVVPRSKLEEPMTLRAVTPYMQVFQTSFGRELWFAGLHAVHHWSMVRVIAGELNIKLQDDFGFAPSTLLYHGTGAPAGKAKI